MIFYQFLNIEERLTKTALQANLFIGKGFDNV